EVRASAFLGGSEVNVTTPECLYWHPYPILAGIGVLMQSARKQPVPILLEHLFCEVREKLSIGHQWPFTF
ncbi:hypothetical protein, partial [Ruegeria sp. HKCCD7319]|uniref:hypothetical protein n=1 Tax=Ruegeria sp. HKCCD7319 TaxID=2683015 RepID=UPI001C110E72